MRFFTLLCALSSLAGICLAQDSNFSTGPQYLMNYGSPQFMRPIATPILSLSTPQPSAGFPETEPVSAQDASAVGVASVGTSSSGSASPSTLSAVNAPLSQENLAHIYWGESSTDAVSQTAGIVEASGATTPVALPASILNIGVQETVDAQSLRARGYGVTVSEVSSYWKTHKLPAAHLYTNRDIERLHGE